jgi:hypothetical protein
MSTRRATSLIELLVVMSACTIILTMSAGLVHRAMHAQTAARAFFDGERSALRLSAQFRADVHQTTTATIEDSSHGDGVFLRLRLTDDEAVEYRQNESVVLRTMTQHGSGLSRTEFAFQPPFSLAIREERAPLCLILSITAGSVEATAPDGKQQPLIAYRVPLSLEIEACLDRNHQVATTPTSQEAPK